MYYKFTEPLHKSDERDEWVDSVYLDIKEAFDRVPHKRLLWKLEHVGTLKGSVLKWMKDYLDGIQRVATKMVPELRELTYEDRLKKWDCKLWKIEGREEI